MATTAKMSNMDTYLEKNSMTEWVLSIIKRKVCNFVWENNTKMNLNIWEQNQINTE